MDRIDLRYKDYFEWLRFVLNPCKDMPLVSDWESLYQFANKQKIIGVCSPLKYNVKIGVDLISVWLGDLIQIQKQNTLVNKRAIEVCRIWQNAGFRCCVLKGQGNAEMYPDPLVRMPGDVDLWIDSDKLSIRDFVTKLFPEAKDYYKHMKFPVFDDVEVDVHHTPLKLRHPQHQRYLQRWITLQKKEQFANQVQITGTNFLISVPTAKFNAVYQLGHIMIHLFDEGIGLRQLIDFFYVMKNLTGISSAERNEIVKTWNKLGMARLASAVMWIESEILGLSERYLLVAPNQRLGEKVLADVLEGGNFGHYSVRQTYRYTGKRVTRRVSSLFRLVRLFPCFPSEMTFQIVRRCTGVVKADIRRMCR